ncbi:MAG: thioredoxin domain-containing protein [Spirochaetales bacterium]|nr:MAG: thioredoxin domain-containing protein [Spirochaetales bacterium]
MANRLSKEKSPYLLQHAGNPVDWFPWGDEAFEKAKAEDKPVFLSIGYSTCHWCHVMAHESFEDGDVAELLNRHFVSVKVDREERPDIDNVYMAACQMLAGTGGWPLSIVMTPEKIPFFAATYIPKDTLFRRRGLKDLLPALQELWTGRRHDVTASADSVKQALAALDKPDQDAVMAGNVQEACAASLAAKYDAEHGGFGEAPKFPSPHILLFLLRYAHDRGDAVSRDMAVGTLKAMVLSGIHDHLAGGFHRYATDAAWKVPHFEKMLYDQALMVLAFTEAVRFPGLPEKDGRLLRESLTATADFVLSDMRRPDDAFYSAFDADSEGEEGRYYLWSMDEIGKAFSGDAAERLAKLFSLSRQGNFTDPMTGKPDGRNILFLKNRDAWRSGEYEELRRELKNLRGRREPPFLDTKILTDWNGLMTASLARAGWVLDRKDYIEAAEKAWAFIAGSCSYGEGQLKHLAERPAGGFLDDYAYSIFACLELYHATFKSAYLHEALRLMDVQIRLFPGDGGFYFSPQDDDVLPARQKQYYDGAVPSGNSVTLHNLYRLYSYSGKTMYRDLAAGLIASAAGDVSRYPSGHAFFLTAFMDMTGEDLQILWLGPEHDAGRGTEFAEFEDVRRSFYLPRAQWMAAAGPAERKSLEEAAPFIRDFPLSGDGPRIYLCSNGACTLPLSSAAELRKALGNLPGGPET